MISTAPIELSKEESESIVPFDAAPKPSEGANSRFSDLRGVLWRINLGILSASASIDELRRVTADARRRYAGLRRHHLVDQNFPKDGSNSPDLVMDNPLSQNPDSMWGRFFKNAELEKMVDQDLSRLYPDHGSYFQRPECQKMLRRVLILWCLRHPEYGYGQGMHELLAPLLYVLHVDVQRLSEVRTLYEDHFNDNFDDMSFAGSGLVCKYKSPEWATEIEDENGFEGSAAKASSLDELDLEIQTIVLLSDAYGAEGELGILLSERFMEHDAYCMFDALMGGVRGAVSMAEYFSPSPAIGSYTGLPPVIEASSALYHLLSIVDLSLHSHLIELGVEPQYFALRWLRVLFGREFSLEDLLVIWDEIFASDNGKSSSGAEDEESSFDILCSPRGAFISAMAVSMLLFLRSSLLATENATSCLQRLLNFPGNIDVKKLIGKAKSLQALALDTSIAPSPALSVPLVKSKSCTVRGHSLSTGSVSPRTPLNLVPESYWEEKWRVLHKAEENQQGSTVKKTPSWKRAAERVRSSLARAESDPSSAKLRSRKKESRSTRRTLLEDLSRELGLDEDFETAGCSDVGVRKDPFPVEVTEEESGAMEDQIKEEESGAVADPSEPNTSNLVEETCPSGRAGSEESSTFSASSSILSRANEHENDDSEKSSMASNSSTDGNDAESCMEEPCEATCSEPPFTVSDTIDEKTSEKNGLSADTSGKQVTGTKERKPLSGKFQWLWKLARNANEGGTSEKGGTTEASKSLSVNQNNTPIPLMANGEGTSPGDMSDNKVMGSLRNLGHSMLENIQVIESVLQQDLGQENMSRNVLVGKGQVTAVAALKELRKISNLLSEM